MEIFINMGNISLEKLVTLISKYLDVEKLVKENPPVTTEMIDGFLQEVSKSDKLKKLFDTDILRNIRQQCRKKEVKELVIYTDGASRGNPGKAGIGVAIYDEEHHLIEELCSFIGESTNNVAEYKAMILAAQRAVHYHAKGVTFKADSELMVRQLNGAYRVKSPNILPLYNELITLLGNIPAWKVRHVRREENTLADILANRGIDSAST